MAKCVVVVCMGVGLLTVGDTMLANKLMGGRGDGSKKVFRIANEGRYDACE